MDDAQLIKRLATIEAHHRLAAEECYRLRTELERVDAPAPSKEALTLTQRAERRAGFRQRLAKKGKG